MLQTFLPLLCACVLGSTTAWSQPYPSRPIKVIVPMQAGTAGDSIMRIVAEQISANIGHPLIIENITGAAGLIGAERIAHAPADGYTIGVMSDSMLAVVPHLQPRINYDPLDGFEPVSMVASITSVLVVNPQLAVANVAEFVTLAKSRKARALGDACRPSRCNKCTGSAVGSNSVRTVFSFPSRN